MVLKKIQNYNYYQYLYKYYYDDFFFRNLCQTKYFKSEIIDDNANFKKLILVCKMVFMIRDV